MKIGLDLDGVLCNIIPQLNKAIRELLHIEPNWNSYNAGIDTEQFAAIHDYAITAGYFADALPYPDVVEVLQSWAKDHEIYYLTARRSLRGRYYLSVMLAETTLEWVALQHFPRGVIHFDHEKATKCREIGFSFFVEDHLDTARTINPICPCYLVDRPWNQDLYLRFGEYDYPWRIKTLRDIVIP